MKEFAALFEESKKIKTLEGITHLLEWDQETYMPKGSAAIRSRQIEMMASLVHKQKTKGKFVSRLQKLIDIESGEFLVKGLSNQQKRALSQWRRDYRISVALPNRFVTQFARLSSEAIVVWSEARKEDNFKKFAPYLTKLVDMSRKKADYLGYEKHPYDALLDLFEPEMTVDELSPLFQKVGGEVKKLLKKIMEKDPIDNSFLNGNFSHAKQLEFGNFVLDKMGYDLTKGRLDLSTHPFSIAMHPTDSRVTTRIHNDSLFDPISAVLHEGGHGLYEMGLLSEHYGSPIGDAISLGIHESQSRFWETFIGQSKPFWSYFFPHLKKMFKGKLEKLSLNQLYRGINSVRPSLIRVEADEVTYCLHVILRFELEKALISGEMSVKEIPEAWNFLLKQLLGITAPNDREGCLQDIHWSMGGFGYFPDYALGNLYGAQFFDTFTKEHTNWKERIAKGDLLFVKSWLSDKIHQHGRTYSAADLIKRVSGKELNPTFYLDYLQNKYSEIYSI